MVILLRSDLFLPKARSFRFHLLPLHGKDTHFLQLSLVQGSVVLYKLWIYKSSDWILNLVFRRYNAWFSVLHRNEEDASSKHMYVLLFQIQLKDQQVDQVNLKKIHSYVEQVIPVFIYLKNKIKIIKVCFFLIKFQILKL